jgi:hypothetical protein
VITIWGPDGSTLASQTIHQIGTVNVSGLVGNQAIGGFGIESQTGGNSLRISQINYDSETRQVDTIQFTSIASQDGRLRESGENSDAGGYSTSNKTGASAIRVGDHKRDKQQMGVLSFDTASLPPGAEIVRATVNLTIGNQVGDPMATLGNVLMDVQTGGFGSDTALHRSDFEAAATAPAAGQLSVGGTSANGNFNASGIAAINENGVTQVRMRFEIDDDDDSAVDYLGFYSGSNSTPSRHPILEIEFEYWAP